MSYIFIFGNHPELSRAELESALDRERLDFEWLAGGRGFHIVNIQKNDLGQSFLNALGGTVKLGRLIKKFPNMEMPRVEDLVKHLSMQGRIFFGLSTYGIRESKQRAVYRLGLEVKKILKASGRSARLVTSRESALSSVVVKKNKLLTPQGKEFLILANEKTFFLGETIAVQEFESYGQRDYGRPERDALSGMLPPKLAQMMVNLSRAPTDGALLDPFCGSGTVLAEAMLLGYNNIIGSDMSEKAIKDSEQNVKWLQQNFKFQISNFKIFQADVTKISQHLEKNSIDAIVTEPYLGPALRGGESLEDIKKSAKKIDALLEKAFEEFSKILKPEGTIVIVIPIFHTPQEDVRPHVLSMLIKKGWGVEFESLYSRREQKVLRDIVILRRIKSP